MTNSVFVVIELWWEHFEVLGVFSSKEKAEKFCKEKQIDSDKKSIDDFDKMDYEVEEFKLDEEGL